VDQDIWVRPGDIIIGDADGIACLPRSLAVRVIEMVPKLVSGGILLNTTSFADNSSGRKGFARRLGRSFCWRSIQEA